MPSTYAFDPTGILPANRITGEQQIITAPTHRNFHFIVPTFAPFFASSIIVSFRDTANVTRTLVEGIDYFNSYQYLGASRACALPIYGGISFLDLTLTGVITLAYNTLGGPWTISSSQITTILSDSIRNPRVTSWEMVSGIPTVFPVVDHQWNQQDLVGMSEVVAKVDLVATAISNRPAPASSFSLSNITNKDQIGLSNVDNFKTATDAESISGISLTRFMTPNGVKKAIQSFLTAFTDAATALAAFALPAGAASIGTQTGQTLAEATLTVGTMANLRALTAPTVATGKTIYVNVLGDVTIGDERPGRYYWVANSALVDDGVNVIVPNSTPVNGRWINVEKDSWLVTSFTATALQASYTLAKAPLAGKPPKVVVNKGVDLVHTVDFNINGKEIVFSYPLALNDTVDICVQLKENRANFDNSWVYGKFAVTGPSQTFTLTNNPRDPRELRIILNDFIILNYSDDWTITGNLVSISYPILNGDSIEIMSVLTEN
jgi:hypothetical protein